MVRLGRVCFSIDHRKHKIAVCHIETRGENVRGAWLDIEAIPRFHPLDAIAEAWCMLCVVISQQLVDSIVMLLDSYNLSVGLNESPVGFRLFAVLDGCRTVHLRMAGKG